MSKTQATFSKMTVHFLVSLMSIHLFFSEVSYSVIILGLSANHRVTPAEELDALPVKLIHGDRYPCRTDRKPYK
jgi:hypothetical protein